MIAIYATTVVITFSRYRKSRLTIHRHDSLIIVYNVLELNTERNILCVVENS
jgi:hypothetical protein